MHRCIWVNCRDQREARVLEAFCLVGQIASDRASLSCRVSPANNHSLDIDPQGHPISIELLQNLPYVTRVGEFETDEVFPSPNNETLTRLLDWMDLQALTRAGPDS